MSEPPMGNFPVPGVDDLPEDLQERIAEEADRAGFIPNVFLAYGYKPSHFRGFFTYYDALVEESALERVEIEMIIVTVSGVNDCLYCVVAHGALCRIYGEAPLLADQLATNHRTADLNEQHRAMLDFAVKLTESPGRVDEADLESLKDAGFSEEAVWDIASVVAFFNLSNRMSTVTDMRPNREFYTLGRDQNGE